MQLVQKMNMGCDFQDNSLEGHTSFYPGVVANPGSRSLHLQMIKLTKKVISGGRFIQTQAVFDVAMFIEFIEAVTHFHIPVIAGIIPIRSARNAHFMNNTIPGIKIPEDMVKRMESAANPQKEGMKIAAEIIHAIKPICQGIHIMPIGGHEHTKLLLEMSGLV